MHGSGCLIESFLMSSSKVGSFLQKNLVPSFVVAAKLRRAAEKFEVENEDTLPSGKQWARKLKI